MSNNPRIVIDKLDLGMVNGPDPDMLPNGAVWVAEGFNTRRGYLRSEYGREKLTASEVVTGAAIKAVCHWERETGTKYHIVACDGLIWKKNAASGWTTFVPMCDLTDTVDSGVIAANVVTPSATARIVRTYQVGDQFYFDADGVANRATITAVTAATFTVNSYGGSATAGAYTVCRHFSGSDIDIVPAGTRVFVTDGVKRPHWWGDNGAGTDIFREAGLPKPFAIPAVAAAAGGALTAGTYRMAVSYMDAAGRIGPPELTTEFDATTNQKATVSGIVAGPSWATRVQVYRSLVNLPELQYCIVEDLTLKAASIGTGGATTVVTLNTNNPSLRASQHKHRYLKFEASGVEYRISDNASNTVTVVGDCSGETATDWCYIAGGFDITQAISAGIADLSSDSELDVDHIAPNENTQPPTKLKRLAVFNGGGSMVAYEDDTMTKSWFSGRTYNAYRRTGDDDSGEGEFDYWYQDHMVGPQDGDEVKKFLPLGTELYCVKSQSFWWLDKTSVYRNEWSWYPIATGCGTYSPDSWVVKDGVAYGLGHEDEQTDVLMFDGQLVRGMFRRYVHRLKGSWLRTTLDSMTNIAEATAAVFKGRLLLSFTSTGTANNKTLDYDFATRAVLIQPWGCGKFSNHYRTTAGSNLLLCGDPADLGNIYSVMATAADNAGNISRVIYFPKWALPTIGTWEKIEFTVVNGATLTAAPVISYSTDDYDPDSGSKSWATMATGDVWAVTLGEQRIVKDFPGSPYSRVCCVKVVSADQKDWGIKRIRVWASDKDQD